MNGRGSPGPREPCATSASPPSSGKPNPPPPIPTCHAPHTPPRLAPCRIPPPGLRGFVQRVRVRPVSRRCACALRWARCRRRALGGVHPGLPLARGTGGAARLSLDLGRLLVRRRPRVRGGPPLGRSRRRGGCGHQHRDPARVRGQAERAPGPGPGPPPRDLGLRKRGSGDADRAPLCPSHPPPRRRRDELSADHGLRRGGRRGARGALRRGHRPGGPRRGRPRGLRPGPRCQLEPREPHHQHPGLRRGPGPRRGAGPRLRARTQGRGRPRGREALSRPRRHPGRLAPDPPRGGRGPGSPRRGGVRPLPGSHRRGDRRDHDGPRLHARGAGPGCAPGHAFSGVHDRHPPGGPGVRGRGLHRRPPHGRHHRGLRGRRGRGPCLRGGGRRPPDPCQCSRGHRRRGRRRRVRTDSGGAGGRFGAPPPSGEGPGRPPPGAERLAGAAPRSRRHRGPPPDGRRRGGASHDAGPGPGCAPPARPGAAPQGRFGDLGRGDQSHGRAGIRRGPGRSPSGDRGARSRGPRYTRSDLRRAARAHRRGGPPGAVGLPSSAGRGRVRGAPRGLPRLRGEGGARGAHGARFPGKSLPARRRAVSG